ncbi:hypothetical protein FSARC_5554 [Fusarium sarcochroum]|uniref:Uncharacterized protein n=1 Tax=Fusarium sarcochroum TaxID=1208366 RepID=A0A8H4TZC3_9HYPO|nr:hypothetical protein FSARC_5554 [Fusarium sarcochroum]
MDASGLDGKESITSLGNNINLDDHQRWITPNPSPWELQELERERLRGSNIEVQQWLQQQPNSQPSRDTFINSQSLHIRKRRTNDIIDHVDDVFGAKSKPSSIQTTGSSTTTALHTRSPPPFNTALPVNEPLQRSRPALQSSESLATTSDRKIRYHDNGNHDEGRPPDTLTSQDWSIISATSSGPQTRGVHKGSSVQPLQKTRWSLTGTDASSASKKLPKRQNSRSTDDETTGKHPFPKRYRSGQNGHPFKSPPSSGSANLALPATSFSLDVSVDTTQGIQRRTRDIPSSSSPGGSGSGSSSAQRDEAARSLTRRLVSHEHFEDACETCFFWLFDPEQFSSSERHACCGRKDEISHIITHAVDHHGLVRGKDPRNHSRKYLTSCQTYSPFMKAKGNCPECSSLYKWKNGDFMDPAHQGVVLCLRCWRKFDKKEMQDHMAGPMCAYNTEQAKSKKVCILYTTFCSETKLPSGPPKNMAPRKSHHRSTPAKHHGSNSRQQANSQPVRQPASSQTPQGLHQVSPQLVDERSKQRSSQMSALRPSNQGQSLMERSTSASHQQATRSHTQQSTSENPFLWQQSNTQEPVPQPIGFVPVYATPQRGFVAVSPMMGMMQRNRNQGIIQSFCPPTAETASFGNMQNNGRSSGHGIRQQQTPFQARNMLLSPGQYHPVQQPLRQTQQKSHQPTPRSMGQAQQQFRQNASSTQLPPNRLVGFGFPQQSLNHFPVPNHALGDAQQQSHVQPISTFTDSATYTDQEIDIFRASFDAVNGSRPQDQIATPVNDFDATISLSGIQSLPSRLQSSPSLVPSTTGESMGLLQSPIVDEPLWLQEEANEVDMNLSWTDYIGLHPDLQTPFEMSDPPPRQSRDRPQGLAPESHIPAEQQATVENDSGYYSGVFDTELDVNKMFM